MTRHTRNKKVALIIIKLRGFSFTDSVCCGVIVNEIQGQLICDCAERNISNIDLLCNKHNYGFELNMYVHMDVKFGISLREENR
jgi:hypothetical protein